MAKRGKARLGYEVSVLLVLLLLASLPIARSESPKPADPPKTFDLEAIDAYKDIQIPALTAAADSLDLPNQI